MFVIHNICICIQIDFKMIWLRVYYLHDVVQETEAQPLVADWNVSWWRDSGNIWTDWNYCEKLQVCCRNCLQIPWPVDIESSLPAFCQHMPVNIIAIVFHNKMVTSDKIEYFLPKLAMFFEIELKKVTRIYAMSLFLR